MSDEYNINNDTPVIIFKFLLSLIWALIQTVYYIIETATFLIIPRPEKSLNGLHVMITGAGRGLGRELAIKFAKEGCRVSCADVDLDGCKETVKIINEETDSDVAKAYMTDVTKRDQISKLAEQIRKDNGPLDILVNNAGLVAADNIVDTPAESIERMVNVNLMAHFWTIKEFLPEMKERKKGHIVSISSLVAFTEAANIAPYTATKFAVTGLINCVREEVRHEYPEIHTTSVHPTFISPPQKYNHWELKTLLPEVTAESVAARTITAIKQNSTKLTVPIYYYYLLWILRVLPTKSCDVWKDTIFAKIMKKNHDQ